MKILLLLVYLVLCKGKKPSCEEFIKDSPQFQRCNPDGSKIYLFNDDLHDFVGSEMECRKHHGHLATPTSVAEFGFLVDIRTERGEVVSGDGPFLSLNNIDGINTNMGNANSAYDSFTGINIDGIGDSDVGFSSTNYACVRLEGSFSAHTATLIAHACDEESRSICEIDYFEGSKIFIPAALPGMPAGSPDEEVKLNWKDADALCKSDDGELVTIDSVQKNLFLTRLLQSRGTVSGCESVWTGMSYNRDCAKFQWSSGSYSVYRKWCSAGEPKVDDTVAAPDQCVLFTAPPPPPDIPKAEKGCLSVEPCIEGSDTEKLYVCEKRSDCDQKQHSLHEFAAVIRQQVGSLKAQCRSCNKKNLGYRG